MRQLASTGVDPYTAVAGAAGALYGPLHGGANEAVLRMLRSIGKKENVPQFLEEVKAKKRRLMGFGHRIYKNYDPRAKLLKQLCHEVRYLSPYLIWYTTLTSFIRSSRLLVLIL